MAARNVVSRQRKKLPRGPQHEAFQHLSPLVSLHISFSVFPRLPTFAALRSLEALQSYQRCGGRFSGDEDVFALAEVVRGLARCGRQDEVRRIAVPTDVPRLFTLILCSHPTACFPSKTK